MGVSSQLNVGVQGPQKSSKSFSSAQCLLLFRRSGGLLFWVGSGKLPVVLFLRTHPGVVDFPKVILGSFGPLSLVAPLLGRGSRGGAPGLSPPS